MTAKHDWISLRVIFDLVSGNWRTYIGGAMVAHSETVESRGNLTPCGGIVPPTTTCVSAGGRRAAPARDRARHARGPNAPEHSSQKCLRGPAVVAGLAQRRAPSELRPSHAAAPTANPFQMASSHEGSYCDRAGSFFRHVSFEAGRMIGDLGIAELGNTK